MKITGLALIGAVTIGLLCAGNGYTADGDAKLTSMGWPLPMSDDECWKVLPKATEGSGAALPSWAKMLAREMPRTAAAFLELDLAQRTASPVDPKLRAAMRWVSANANGSPYAKSVAKADALRAGVTEQQWQSLESKERKLWNDRERTALEFAYQMTVDSDGVTDALFQDVVKAFDERQAASMVLLMAYSNFQDRLLNCLGAPLEEGGPMPPVKVRFAPEGLVSQTTPPSNKPPKIPGSDSGDQTKDIIADDAPNTWLPYPQLQERLEKQRKRATRLRIPNWEEFASKLPKGLMEKPSDIVWYKIAFGYAHELAVPFEIYMRTAGSEVSVNWDRLFGNCIFWIVTDAIKCPYCMGHCEMNWEVAGLNSEEIAEISRQLAGDDWSKFTIPQQQALAFARKLTLRPATIDRKDMDMLREGFGEQRAFFIALNASRYNYMTRISNGFQLTLESDNPFWDYYKMKPPTKSASLDQPRPTPLTRPEMKRMLEEMKERKERIPVPQDTAANVPADPRSQGYEGRLSRSYLPATAGARGYLNFSGSPQRTSTSNTGNRPNQEPDPALTLDYGFKTRLFWIASRANNCQYCLGHQETKLLNVGMTDDRIALLDTDWSVFPPEEQAAFALARRLTLQPHLLSDADIQACKAHYSDLQVLEMVLSVAGNNAINRWKEGAGIPQSKTGGFGGPDEPHSYLTATSDPFKNLHSKVVSVIGEKTTVLPTTMDRKSELMAQSVSKGLADCQRRVPRLPVASEAKTREAFGEAVPQGTVPGWMRVLANFPIAGKRQLMAFLSAENDLDLSALDRAQMSWVIARQNGAWYSLSQAEQRLKGLGQSDAQIADLNKFVIEQAKGSLGDREYSLLVLAKKLGASPVILTDAQVEEALRQTGPREVVQAIHYTAMRSLFDRFTEAAGLPSDQ